MLTLVLDAVWGTMIGASNSEVKTSPLFPIENTVPLCFNVVLWKIPLPTVSSTPIKSSLEAPSSNCTVSKYLERIKLIVNLSILCTIYRITCNFINLEEYDLKYEK